MSISESHILTRHLKTEISIGPDSKAHLTRVQRLDRLERASLVTSVGSLAALIGVGIWIGVTTPSSLATRVASLAAPAVLVMAGLTAKVICPFLSEKEKLKAIFDEKAERLNTSPDEVKDLIRQDLNPIINKFADHPDFQKLKPTLLRYLGIKMKIRELKERAHVQVDDLLSTSAATSLEQIKEGFEQIRTLLELLENPYKE